MSCDERVAEEEDKGGGSAYKALLLVMAENQGFIPRARKKNHDRASTRVGGDMLKSVVLCMWGAAVCLFLWLTGNIVQW